MRTVHVWWDDLTSADITRAMELPEAERARLAELTDQAARGRRLVGQLLLQRAIGFERGVSADPVPIDRTCLDCGAQHGRPEPADGLGPHVSVAHAGVVVVVASCATAPIGIDVERGTSEAIRDWVAREAGIKTGSGPAPDADGRGAEMVMLPIDTPRPGYLAALAVLGSGPVRVVQHHRAQPSSGAGD